ncbi:MAG: hypothetical protein ACYSUD_07510 [Planctomycetota bacterium]
MAEDKKRSVTALCLVTVMVFMWIKVFTKKAPEGAGAALMTGQVEHGNQVNERYRVLFIELPKVAGRNDVIVRDFFASDGWQHFVNGKERKPTDNGRQYCCAGNPWFLSTTIRCGPGKHCSSEMERKSMYVKWLRLRKIQW